MPKALALPAELSIYAVGELRPQLLSWADGLKPSATAKVDGAAVDVVDAAGVQLLLSLSHTLNASGKPMQLINASTPLAAACEALGLSRLLPTEAGAGARA